MIRWMVAFFSIGFLLFSSQVTAQDWDTVYMQTFYSLNSLAEVPNLSYSQSFSIQAPDNNDPLNKAAYTGFFSQAANSHLAFWFDNFSTQYEYRIQCKANSYQSNSLKLQYRYNSQAGYLGTDIGTPLMIPQGSSGQVLISEPFELNGENYLILAPGATNQPQSVFIDDFVLERRLLNNTTIAVAFTTSSPLSITEGNNAQVCLNITNPSATQATMVTVALSGSASPHFDDFTPQTLTFPANSSDQQCFTLQTDSDNGEVDVNNTYTLILENLMGEGTPEIGEPGMLTVTVEDIGVPDCEGYAGPDHEICQGVSVTLGCASNPEEYCYKWEPEEGLDSPYSPTTGSTPNSTTVYTVHVTDDDGNYYGSDTVTVEVDFTVELAETFQICAGDSLSLTPVITGGSGNFTYAWNTGDTTASIIVSPEESTAYELTVVDTGGDCTVQVNTLVEVREMPEIFITANYPAICELGEPSLNLAAPKNKSNNTDACDNTSTILHTNLEGDYNYLWSTGETTDSISAVEVGLYSVTITDNQSGCTETASYEVHSCLQVAISPSIRANNGQIEYVLDVEAPPGSSFQWEDENESTVNPLVVLEPGDYTVTVTTEEGCVISETIIINLPCTMPKDGYAYTPAHAGLYLKKGTPIQFYKEDTIYEGQLYALLPDQKKYTASFFLAFGQFAGYRKNANPDNSAFTLEEELEQEVIDSVVVDTISTTLLGVTKMTEDGCRCVIYEKNVGAFGIPGTDDGTTGELVSAYIDFPPDPYLEMFSQETSAAFCATPTPDNSFDLITLLDLILDNGAINSISKEVLDSTLNTIPAYLDTYSYAGCYYYYDRQNQTLKIYQDVNGPTTISDTTIIKQKLEEIQNGQVPSGKDYIAFFEHNEAYPKNVTFELFIQEGVLTPAQGSWATTPTEAEFREIVKRTLKQKFETSPTADASVYPNDTIPGQGMWDGQLSTKDEILLKWIAFGFGEFKHVINHAEINPEIWNPDNENYDLKPLTIMVPIAGAGDQSLAELKDLKELVELMATVLDDPKGTLEDIYEGLANIEISEIDSLIFTSIQSQWDQITAESYEGQYQRARAGTQVVAVIIKLTATGVGIGQLILPFVDKVQKILDFVRRFSNPNIKDKLTNLPTLQAEKFVDDFKDVGDEVIGEFDAKPGMVDAWTGMFNTGLRTDIPWLKRANKWLDEGAELATDGTGKLTKNGENILQIKNDKILPDKYDYPVTSGTHVGEPANGYQVVKNGGNLSVRRVPETSGYSETDLEFLTQNSSSHALARHGHDVTDDALIKRATVGISPEGVPNTFPAGGVATKFSSEQAVKDAIDNIKPGTPAFDARVQQPNGLWEVEAPGNYGYGFKSNGSGGPQQMLKVTAVYKEMPNGFFELITMYPNK